MAKPAPTEAGCLSLRGRPLVAGVLLLVLAAVVAFAAPRYATAPVRIVIDATPITSFDDRDPSRVRFGDLEFRGGLALESKHPAFGGISGLHVEPAATDSSRLPTKAHGCAAGLFIATADQPALPTRKWRRFWVPMEGHSPPVVGTIPSLAERDGVLYVGIERVEQIVRFDYRRDGLLARGQPIMCRRTQDFTYNKSLECVAAPQQGSLAGELIAVSEHSLDGAGNLRSFLIGADHVTRFSIKRTEDFDVSDCTIIPPDDLLLLERRFSIVRGIGMRMRRIPLQVSKRVRCSTAVR